MSFQIRTEQQPTLSGRDGTIYILENAAKSVQAAIWPALGFNCYRWQMIRPTHALDLLYAGPQWFRNEKSTHSGVPILFPFPNRIREGRFDWEGKNYQIPLEGPGRKNAIHGFVHHKPWRVVDQGADAQGAWLVGEFRGSRDAPEYRDSWPADYQIRVTYRLGVDRLRLDAVVSNPDTAPLPFGLGYHPYFRIPLVPNTPTAGCWAEARAHAYWQLQDFLPTGRWLQVDASHDLTAPRRFTDLRLDDVLTDLERDKVSAEGLYFCGGVRQPDCHAEIRLWASPTFRELVLYTPPHRQAICLEPYTCTTDAIHLQSENLDAGLHVLQPGETWTGTIEIVVAADGLQLAD